MKRFTKKENSKCQKRFPCKPGAVQSEQLLRGAQAVADRIDELMVPVNNSVHQGSLVLQLHFKF